MKRTKSIPDSVRNALVKTSTAIFEPIEARLERSEKGETAQKLRKLQYRFIGLTEDQWQYIADYFGCEELLHIALQGQEKALRLYNELMHQLPVNDPVEMDRYKEDLGYYEGRLQMYRDFIHSAEGVMGLIRMKMERTPLYRAIIFHQRDSDWYLKEWLRGKCAGNRGCCGRSCGCCEKPRGTTRGGVRFSHCTPLCDCCERYRGHKVTVMAGGAVYPREVNLISKEEKRYLHTTVEYAGQVKFDPREEKNDMDSALLMNAYVWGLDLRKRGKRRPS